MILGIGVEAGVFLYAGLTGMTVWFFYGILICLRKIIPHTSLFVGVEDFLFWIGTSIYIFRAGSRVRRRHGMAFVARRKRNLRQDEEKA